MAGNGTSQSSLILRQHHAYQLATDMSKGKLTYNVMPVGMFIIHDLRSLAGKKFRCEWLHEYLQWADRDQPPLFFTIAKIAMDRNYENKLHDGLVAVGGNRVKNYYMRLFNNTSACKGRTCRIHYRPFFYLSKEKGYDITSKNTGR